MNQPWDQRPDESAKVYAAFRQYLELGPSERSLDKAYQTYISAKSRGHQKGTKKKAPGRWKRWSVDYEWTDRVQAYDAHQQRQAMIRTANRRQKDIEAFINADFLISQGVQRIISKKIVAMMNQEPTEVNASELRQVVLAYDGARGWLVELIGLFDDETNPISQLAVSDEALAQRQKEEN